MDIRLEYVLVRKKLTITLDEEVYNALHRVVGRGKISQFIEGLVRPHVDSVNLDDSYESLRNLKPSTMKPPLGWRVAP